ncbi:hypothetical protein Rctr85_064 [Virus Rctr85]|nr:hypothetical protein Rctr85_064 [Virus Rctr85]
MLHRTLAYNLYAHRDLLASAEADLKAIETRIEDLVKQHAPDLLTEKARLEDRRKDLRKGTEEAKNELAVAIRDVALSMTDPYGVGKTFPFATVENKTFVEAEMDYAGIVAAWLIARGLLECVQFKFTPIAAFQNVPDSELPRTPDGRKTVLKVFQGPNVKIHDHERWTAPEEWGNDATD